MTRALFVYWKIDPGDAAAAAAALHDWHGRLQQDRPDLQVALYRRADDSGEQTTLMETYAAPGGLDPALQARLVSEGDALCAPWRQGRRHVEVFEPWPASGAGGGAADGSVAAGSAAG